MVASSITSSFQTREIIECKESRIGKQPVQVPYNVTITLVGQILKIKGLLGELSRNYPREVKIERDENGILQVKKALNTKRANQMHRLLSKLMTLTNNMVVGVFNGSGKRLQVVSVGYRANIVGKDLVSSLGFSRPVRMTIPRDLQVKVEKNTGIVVSGNDKYSIGECAASIQRWRPPEPYKGKGERYANEVRRLKEGKVGKSK